MDLEPARFYQALVDLGRSLAKCKEPDSVLEGLAQTLQTVVKFHFLALMLYDGAPESLQIHTVTTNEERLPNPTYRKFEVKETPVGVAWESQEPVIMRHAQTETRWPEFVSEMVRLGVQSLV